MSIKGNFSSGLVAIPAGDVTILQNITSNRWVVTAVHVHDQTGVGDTVELFVSSDAISAPAERIDKLVMAVDETKDSAFVPVVLEAGEFLLGKGVVGGLLVVEAVYTKYDGDS